MIDKACVVQNCAGRLGNLISTTSASIVCYDRYVKQQSELQTVNDM